MIHLRASRYGGQAHERGFTVLELLIALTVTLLLASAMAGAAPSAAKAFERVPAELDQQQRGRSAIDTVAQMLRSATSIVDSGDPEELTAIAPVVNGGRGVLAIDQAGTALNLGASPCPAVSVCGFASGATAVISDASGRHDVFTIAATNSTPRRLTASRAFAPPYPAGSTIVEIDQYTYRLASQSDGSYSLVRETAAGAIQPMVDFVRDLSFRVDGDDVDVSLSIEAATESLRHIVSDRRFETRVRIRNRS